MNYPVIPRTFFSGDCFDAYRILGAHPCTDPNGAEGWRFAVWAPGATAVEVCGGFDGWERGVPMEKADTGVWSAFIPGLAEGDLYKYRVHGADGSAVMRSDPYAFATELRPGTASKLTKLDFTFDDTAWMERRDKCRNRPLNIYELHAGSWKHKPGATRPDGFMKINDIDWSKVPDILAKEQVRLLCHCSKRTALYYLKSGKLPCIYSGKKTRCYKIRKEDLMAFIEDRENHPEFYAVPEGWYKESGRTVRQHYSSEIKIDGEDLHEYYRFLFKEYPDVLEVKKVSEITGYAIPVINRWCNKGKVKYFSIRAMNMIPKIYLIDFFCSNAFRTIPRKSEWHISSLQNYRRWKYLDSLQSK